MRYLFVVPTLLAALALPSVAAAGVGAGDLELGINVSTTTIEITTDDGFGGETTSKSESGNIGGSFGYFVTDIIEAKGAVTMTITSNGNYGIFSPGADAVFMMKTVAPFVGAAYGLAFGDTLGPVDSDFIDVHGGMKFFLSDRASFELKLTRFEPMDSASKAARTELSAGINVYF